MSIEKIAEIKNRIADERGGRPIHEMTAHYLEGIFQILCVVAEVNLSRPTPENVPVQDLVADLMGEEPKKKTRGRGRPAIKSR